MTPSKYQQDVFDWVENGNGNALVCATAGSGKTSSLMESIKLMKGSVLFVAFSKKIQMEIAHRLGKLFMPNAQASTFHAVGFAAIRKSRRNVKVTDKMDLIMDEIIHHDEDAKYVAGFVKRIVALAKDSAFGVPGCPDIEDREAWMNIAMHHDLTVEDGMEYGIDEAIDIAIYALKESNKDRATIDYADMIYQVLLFDIPCQQYDWLLVDEAQDTNVSRRLLAAKLLKKDGRAIFVGDEWQSIFGFCGADNDAMQLIAVDFNCQKFPLSICYRCDKNIVLEAQKINPTIEAFEDNRDGLVSSMTYDEFVKKIPELNITGEDGIICRNNAPLVPLAFSLIRKGVSCRIEGKDIGNQLAQFTYKWKDNGIVNFLERFNNHMDKEIEKAMAKKNNAYVGNLQDKKDTMGALVQRCLDLQQTSVMALRELIISMFSDSDGKVRKDLVTLSSVHKSKGLEFSTVYSIGRGQFMPSPYATQDHMLIQERNLNFVLVTRAKHEFIDITDVPSVSQKRVTE